MTFPDTQRQVENAGAALARAAAHTPGWADQQRRDFDTHLMKPLADAAVVLSIVLRKAQEAQQKAERLMSD